MFIMRKPHRDEASKKRPEQRVAASRWPRRIKRSALFFASLVAIAVLSTALVPTGGTATTALGLGGSASAAPKQDRLALVDMACQGQAWGHETLNCLAAIARDSGRAATAVRIIADAPALTAVPNVF